jgi:biopolymer transport protein ExbD
MATRRTNPAPEVTLPVTPMLDMTFQLLFFFLATFNPSSAREGQMALILPSKRDGNAPGPLNQVERARFEEVEETTVVTVRLRGYKDPVNRGLISEMTVNTDHGDDVELNGSSDQRSVKLRHCLEGFKPDEKRVVPTVRVVAESDIRWSQVMNVMDVCRRVGYRVRFTNPVDLVGGG